MGLETVELVMDVEDEFGITIPDEALTDIQTVGEFHDFVARLVRADGRSELRTRSDLDAYLWSRIQALASQQAFNVKPEQITRETRFVEDLGYG